MARMQREVNLFLRRLAPPQKDALAYISESFFRSA